MIALRRGVKTLPTRVSTLKNLGRRFEKVSLAKKKKKSSKRSHKSYDDYHESVGWYSQPLTLYCYKV